MTVHYNQSGKLTLADGFEIAAYSGHGVGLNNPALEDMANIGPIPRGKYRVVAWHDNYEDKGSVVAQLEPVGHDAHGRSGFLCHGDNPAMNHTASHGCIIADHEHRKAWRDSGETDLEVT